MSGLDRFNSRPAAELAAALSACNASPAWVAAVAAGRPYRDVAVLLGASDAACRQLGPDEVDQALSGHPPIGEPSEGDGAGARLSRHEQAPVSDADKEVRSALAAGNRAYEQQFGRVFLIRAAGRSPQEILGELRRRLANDAETESREVAEQLCQITRLRLEGLVG